MRKQSIVDDTTDKTWQISEVTPSDPEYNPDRRFESQYFIEGVGARTYITRDLAKLINNLFIQTKRLQFQIDKKVLDDADTGLRVNKAALIAAKAWLDEVLANE